MTKEKRYNMKIKALKLSILTGIIFMCSSNIIFAEKPINISRISGSDRYDTSVKISEEINNNGIISIASGEHFADALSAGWLATQCKAPLLLVKKNEVPKNVYDRIVLLKANKTALVGGNNYFE